MRGWCSAMRKKRLQERFLPFLLCVIIVLPFSVIPAFAASGENAKDILTVGVPLDRCPIFYADADTKEITGIGADLMRYAAQAAGFEVRFQDIGDETLKDALDCPDYDVVMPFGSAVPSASGKANIVSENLMQTPFTLVTEGRGKVPSFNHLHIGMLASQAGVAETVRQLYPDIEISLYEDMPDCVGALRAGTVDALLNNSYLWSYVLQKPSYNDLTVQPSTMFSMDFRAGTPDTPEGRAIIERLNGGIAAISDHLRQAVILDYTSRRLYRYDFSDYLHQYGLFLLRSVLLLAAVLVIALQRLHAVRKTHEAKMQQMLDRDPLTGLPNMNGFRKQVKELLRANPDTPYILSYNNIRDFKFINDSLGRDAGDALLQFWADKSMAMLSEK